MTLPLPKTWLARPTWAGDEQNIRDTALAGRAPNPGTQDHLRMLLATSGWSSDVIDSVNLDMIRYRLFDMFAEQDKRDPELGTLATNLRKAGLQVDLVKKIKQKPSVWLQETWKSLTLFPWWTASNQGQKSLVLLALNQVAVEGASALFLRDLWANLGQPPMQRMPVFRRISLVSLMSPEAMNHYFTARGSTTDVLVVHGGFLDVDSMYQTFSYLAAVQSMFHGFLLYEAVPPKNVDTLALAEVARRSGFPLVFGVA